MKAPEKWKLVSYLLDLVFLDYGYKNVGGDLSLYLSLSWFG